MKIEGEHHFEARREAVWEALLDPEVIRRVMPGCEDLKPVGDDRFEGALKIKVGPVQGLFQGSVALTDQVPPESYRLELKGRGAPGFVDGEGRLRLSEADGGTTVHYTIDAKVGGRIASVGQRLLDSSAKVLSRQAFEGLERQLEARRAGAAAGAAESVEAPSQAEFAGRFAKGLLAELVPPERRALVATVAVLVLLGAAFLLFRACSG